MPTLLDLLRDKQFRSDVATNSGSLAQAASNSIAGNIGVPVDALAWLLRKGGLPVPSNPVGGTDWMAQKGLTREVPEGAPKLAGETLGALAPFAFAKPAVNAAAAGMNQLEANLAAPATLGKQRGVLAVGDRSSPTRLPFAQDAERAYEASIPERVSDRAGNEYSVSVGPRTVRFENPGTQWELRNDPYYLSTVDPNLGNTAAAIFRARDNKQMARAISDELMAPANIPNPEWARIPGNLNTQAAGPEWWASALRNKSNASFDAFADAAKDTPLMLYGKGSSALDAADVAKAYPGLTAKQSGGDLMFSGKNGGLMVMGADTANPVIRSTMAGSKGVENGGGKELYQAAYNWAGNNKKLINPDVGLSDINELRKLGNVLSAQIRTGEPIANMNAGGLTGIQGIPQVWQAEAKLATSRAPEIKALKFDGTNFNMADNALLSMLAKKDPSFDRGVGVMTAKRAAIANWLKTASPDDAKKAAAALAASGSGAVFANSKD